MSYCVCQIKLFKPHKLITCALWRWHKHGLEPCGLHAPGNIHSISTEESCVQLPQPQPHQNAHQSLTEEKTRTNRKLTNCIVHCVLCCALFRRLFASVYSPAFYWEKKEKKHKGLLPSSHFPSRYYGVKCFTQYKMLQGPNLELSNWRLSPHHYSTI